MTFKKFLIAVFLFFILFSGCAQYNPEPPLSGEPVPTMESTHPPAPDATGGGTVLNESEF